MLPGTMYNHIELACAKGVREKYFSCFQSTTAEKQYHNTKSLMLQLNICSKLINFLSKWMCMFVTRFTLSPIAFPFLKAENACKIWTSVPSQI
jgi:hypothetical protein